jgi:hypothetical protein
MIRRMTKILRRAPIQLDAIDARAYADDLRTQQPHCRGDFLV